MKRAQSLKLRSPQKRIRDEEVWRLRVYEGLRIEDIAARLKIGSRTVDRILAKMRKKYCIEKERHLTRSLGESVSEKRIAQRKMLEIMQRPPRRDSDGRVVDDAHVRIEAARLYVQISNDMDRLFGIDQVDILRRIDKIEQKLKSTEENH